jgi:hypothetical protein
MFSWLNRGIIAAAILLGFIAAAEAQSFPLKFDSAANTNATEVIIGKTQIRYIVAVNQTATVNYLKLYDVATAPTCGTTTPVLFKVALPASTSNPVVLQIPIPDGMQFQNGVGMCLTGAVADNDSSNAVTGIIINFGVKQ